MFAKTQAMPDSTHTVFIEASHLAGANWQIVVGIVFGIYRTTIEERHDLIEHTNVRRSTYVATQRERQPQVIVRATCTHATTGWWMPPVLHIPFTELTAGT